MKIRFLLFILLLLSLGQLSFAQQHACGTDYLMGQYLQSSQEARRAKQIADQAWKEFASRPIDPQHLVVYENNDTIFEIPVVFHVMHAGQNIGHQFNPTDAEILAYLAYCNQAFAATFAHYANIANGGVKVPIRFVMAQRTPGCNPQPTNGIVRVNAATTYPNYATNGIALMQNNGVDQAALKNLSRWDRNQYYNIWLVNYIDGPSNTAGGFAYLPPNAPEFGDGAVLLSEYTTPMNNSGGNYYNAFPHEIGHSFGLQHTFEGIPNNATCASNTNCLEDNDMVCDTEIHPLITNRCPTNSETNPCTNLPYNNVQYNMMNYAPCYTNKRFTVGQRTRMIYHLMNYRQSLIHSLGAVPPPATPPARLLAATCNPPLANTNPNNGFLYGPTKVKFGNFEYATFAFNEGGAAYIDYSCMMTPPEFVIGQSYPMSIRSFENLNNNRVRVYIDFDNDGTFTLPGEQVLSGETGSNNAYTVSGNIAIPNGAVTCTPIRMRVIGDSDYRGPCATLQYGEAEDYAILLKPSSRTPPVLSVTSNVGNNICTGTSATFTATANNTPANAVIRWYKNNVLVGNGATYTTNTIVTNDEFRARISYPSSCNVADSVASNVITMTVLNAVTPTITIANSQNNTVCQGQALTFTASATGVGTPTYQWKVNGINAGTNSATFAPTNLANGDVVTCTVTSSLPCVTVATVTSTAVVVTVTPSVTPQVTLVTNNNNLCISSTLTFTAAPVNGGSAPTYQWRVNGNVVTATGNTFTSNTLIANDVVTVSMTSNATCRTTSTVNSNAITVISTASGTPTVNVTSNKTNHTICQNESITFTALPVSGGSAPTYQWKVNGINAANATSNTFTIATLNNGDLVTVDMVSNAPCLATPNATSTAIAVVVTAPAMPSVTISTTNNNVCVNNTMTFYAHPVNGGNAPSYQWRVNGVNVSATGSSYTTSNLNAGDLVTVAMISNASCIAQNNATSAGITIIQSGNLTPSVTIASNKTNNEVCHLDTILFTATPTLGGNNPVYQWRVNGINVAGNGATFATNSLSNNDVVSVVLTANAPCLGVNTAASNAETVTVINAGPIFITPDSLATVCEFNALNLTVQNATGSISWYVNDTLVPNRNTSMLSVFREGNYYAVNEFNGCSSRSNTTTIVLAPLAAPVIQFVNGAYEVDTIYDTYKWYFNNAWIANNPTNRHIPHAYGSFKICVTKGNCSSCSESVSYPDPLNIKDVNTQTIKIYPNPTSGKIYVDYDKKLNIEVRALDGRILKVAHKSLSIDIAEFASGAYLIYLIDIETDQLIQTNKLFKD